MKKWVCLLALALLLNGVPAMAGEIENTESVAAAEPTTEGNPTPDESAEAPAGASGAPQGQADEAGAAQAPGDNSDDKQGEGPGETPAENAGETPDETAAEPSDAATPAEASAPESASSDATPPASEAGEPAAPAENPAPIQEPAPAAADETQAPDGQSAEVAAPETSDAPAEQPAEEETEARFEAAAGTLEELLNQITGKGTVYLRVGAEDRAYVESAPLGKLSQLAFEPDGDVFEGGNWAAYISADDPKATERPALAKPSDFEERAEDETAPLYFWVAEKGKYADPEPTPAPTATPVPSLTVTAENLRAGEWSGEMPAFTLSGIPEGAKYSYAAIIYDERIVPLSGNTFTPDAEGKYSLRFAMLDGIGDIVSASDTYDLWLDATPPEAATIAMDEAMGYTMHITASDALSGLAAISLDGGANWTPLSNDETFTYTGTGEEVFSAGAIQLMDAAGNLWRSAAETRLEAVEEAGGYGGYGGGGGGGGGDGKPAPSHASGNGEEGAQYEALSLELPEAPMTRLTLGGEELPLALVLDSAQAEGAPVGQERPFTASLVRWTPPKTEADPHENVLANGGEAANTLLLAAEPEALGDQFAYTWRFNGEVYRLLSNSGVKYVALKVDDDVAAFPTEGFTGGTKYTELKMLGVSTRKFDYTLTMKVNLDPGYVSAMSDCDFSQTCDLSIRAEVENMAYELSGSTNSLMYFYDVYLGPEDMMEQPFGEYNSAL